LIRCTAAEIEKGLENLKNWYLLFLTALLLLASCDLKTSVDFDRNADFSAIETYAWVGRKHPEISDLTHKRIVAAVEEQMGLEGLTKVESNPDVYVTYHGDDNQRTVIDTTHYGYGYGPGWYWGGYGGVASSTSRVRTYTEGTLIIDIYDAAKKELVWRGTVTGTVSDNPRQNEKNINKGVAKVFKKFPPPEKG
jgi:hypothetical protein